MALPIDYTDRENQSYKENSSDGGVDRRTNDLSANEKLTLILAALGGAVSVTPTIFNVAVPDADTEVSQVLPLNTKRFILKVRDNSQLQLSYTSTESGTKFITIPPDGVFEDENLHASTTLFFQTNKASQIVEILAYS